MVESMWVSLTYDGVMDVIGITMLAISFGDVYFYTFSHVACSCMFLSEVSYFETCDFPRLGVENPYLVEVM